MAAYYNEIDPYAAQWLRNLIAKGHIAPGEVDERSISDVHPADLKEFTQHHFFAQDQAMRDLQQARRAVARRRVQPHGLPAPEAPDRRAARLP